VQPAPTPRITLHILRGRASQKSRVMTGTSLLIGSDSRCDVQMRAASVAPRHCLVSRREDGVLATRLSADHPLLVNGQPAAEERLKDGDVLALGPFELRVEFSAAESPSAPAKPSNSEPPAVHRPRFALLDRKPTAPPAIAAEEETNPELPSLVEPPTSPLVWKRQEEVDEAARRNDLREQELREKDERLQDWANRLEATEAEIEKARATCQAALVDCQRRRKTLDSRRAILLSLRAKLRSEQRDQQSRFANLLADAEKRAASLNEREQNLDSREERVRRVAEELDARQAEVNAREQRTADELDRLERRHEALQRERGMLDKEWQRLFSRQQEIVQETATLDRRAERVAAQESLLAEARQRSKGELRALQHLSEKAAAQSAEIDVRSVKLRGRERVLDERAVQLSDVDQRLRDRESELNQQAVVLQRRATEAQQQIETQQRSIEARRTELEEALRRHDEDKRSLHQRQEVWKSEVTLLTRAKEEIDRRTSLLAARERSLSELEAKGYNPAELERRFMELRREQENLAAEAADAGARRKKLDAETTKLAEIAAELSERQRELLERERRLAESAAKEHEAIDREADRLQQEQAALDAKAEEQRRNWERLKTSAARMGSRRKVMLERLSDLETKFEDCKREIAQLVDSRRRLRASLDEYVRQAEKREREALEWLRGVRAESDAVADAHRRFTKQFDVAVGATAPIGLKATLGDWWLRMSKLQRRISNGEQILKSSPTSRDDSPSASNVTEPAPAVFQLPKAEPPTGPAAPIPPRWLFKLVELGLADEDVLTYILVNARERKAAVEDLLVEQGIVTHYQLDCVANGQYDALQFGSAKVLDLLHDGSVATTYLVSIPSVEKSAVLRLLHPNLLTDEGSKAAYLDHLRGAMRFRHPSAAAVLGPFEHAGRIGVFTEHAAGRPLSEAAASMPPTEIVGCFRQCLGVLFAGQRAGFLHRNLRPSRIIVSSLGRTILLGFGEPDWLVRLQRSRRDSSDEFYVAPEDRAAGRPADARADLFSLCRIFLEAVLGRRPAPGESIASPSGYSDAVLELLIRGVQGDPAKRCRSFSEVIHEVDRCLAAGVPTTPSRTARNASRAAA
jgi:hypothetical protein